ncbi:hypothetical protein [Oceanobacillus kapialis]|uniref:Uncharacterized protein n=1 Tax=Oceanobacillus kapialis TaxID=481353 RepID=A0ABW5Q2P7_9BACI
MWKRSIMLAGILFILFNGELAFAELDDGSTSPVEEKKEPNWQVQDTYIEKVDGGEHEFTYWKNFMRHTRTCQVTHHIKVVVYYDDVHDQTKTESTLIKTEHSARHK